MLQTWQRLGHPRVGARELRRIQSAVAAMFGPGAVASPAAIARVLADEGAQLVHPEVLEFDARWREKQFELQAQKFQGLEPFVSHERLDFSRAEALIEKLQELRQRFRADGDEGALKQLTTIAADLRRQAENAASNAEQLEIAEWFKVWIQTPRLFSDWLELRKASPDFRQKFLGVRRR